MSTGVATSLGQLPFLDITDAGFHFSSPEIAWAREENWCARTPVGLVPLRYAEVQELLREPRLFQDAKQYVESFGITEGIFYDRMTQMILFQKGDDHRRLRGLLNKTFTPRMIKNTRLAIRSTVDDLVDRFVERIEADGAGDFVDAVSDPLPASVISYVLGVPPGDYDIFRDWSTDINLAFSLAYGQDILPRIEKAIIGWSDYVVALIKEKRKRPADDLLSSLIAASDAGERLTELELCNLVLSLVTAAHDTTRNALAGGLFELSKVPDQWTLLAEQPELVPRGVEEIVRWCPSIPLVFRFCGEDFSYRGLDIPAGTFFLLNLNSANRDPRVFDNADTFDIRVARDMPALSFGGGMHYCLGNAMARTEMTEALHALTQRLGPPSLAGPVTWGYPIGIYGPETLPLRFG